MTEQQQHHQQKRQISPSKATCVQEKAVSEEEQDILEIIEELPDEECDQFDDNKETNTATTAEDSLSRPSIHDFSLSSISFALGGALHASTSTLGSATASLHSKSVEKLRQSFGHIQTQVGSFPATDSLSQTNNHSNHSSTHGINRQSLRAKFANDKSSPTKTTRSSVDFGRFEARAVRLQYTQDDIFAIVEDPAQFDDLRNALRSLGAVTNTVVQQKIHWYVKNSKRAREQQQRQQWELEQQQQQRELEQRHQQQQRELEQQQEHKEAESEVEPITPPSEYKVFDGDKMLQSAQATEINPEDPSPTSVRGIFVPST